MRYLILVRVVVTCIHDEVLANFQCTSYTCVKINATECIIENYELQMHTIDERLYKMK